MLLTEEEAKTKVCHKTMAAFNEVNGPGPWNCLASACMAWREIHEYRTHPNGSWFIGEGMEGDEERVSGYCGLAGKP